MIKVFYRLETHRIKYIIHSTNYCSSVAHINNLYHELQKDLGQVNKDDINIVMLGSEKYKRMLALEVTINDTDPVSSRYNEIGRDIFNDWYGLL